MCANGYYVALKASNVVYLIFNEHLTYHKMAYLKSLKINDKISKIGNFAP